MNSCIHTLIKRRYAYRFTIYIYLRIWLQECNYVALKLCVIISVRFRSHKLLLNFYFTSTLINLTLDLRFISCLRRFLL